MECLYMWCDVMWCVGGGGRYPFIRYVVPSLNVTTTNIVVVFFLIFFLLHFVCSSAAAVDELLAYIKIQLIYRCIWWVHANDLFSRCVMGAHFFCLCPSNNNKICLSIHLNSYFIQSKPQIIDGNRSQRMMKSRMYTVHTSSITRKVTWIWARFLIITFRWLKCWILEFSKQQPSILVGPSIIHIRCVCFTLVTQHVCSGRVSQETIFYFFERLFVCLFWLLSIRSVDSLELVSRCDLRSNLFKRPISLTSASNK